MTLSQYQQLLGNTIRMNPALQGAWVVAEMSDLRIAGGHCYMELVEKDNSGNTCAKMRAMIWAGTLPGLRRKFYDATGRDIQSGMKVMVRGSANHHNLYGLSFTISDIDPSYTLGDIERIRREILERLYREGILNRNRGLSVPSLPQRVAVISASGAAGYGDFMNQIHANADGFKIYTGLFEAVMQGERVSQSVRKALEQVESTIDLWDCVVIIRGGGATTDLIGFDDYELARAVALFPIPVVVGIGHERDRTVLDEIACVRCKTPTAVAAWIIDSLRLSYTKVVDLARRVATQSAEALKGENYRLANLESTLPVRIQSGLMRAEKRLTESAHRLERALSRRSSIESERIGRLGYRMERALSTFTQRPMMRLEKIEAMIRVLSPENTLKRGYSITRVNGHAVREVTELMPGEVIETQLPDGKIYSSVKVVEKENEV